MLYKYYIFKKNFKGGSHVIQANFIELRMTLNL